MIKSQIEYKKALEAQKLQELELIKADLKVLELQLKGEEEILAASTKEEEKKKSQGKEIYLGPRTYSETIKKPQFPQSPMKILGKLPSFTLDDFHITSRKEQDSHVQFSEEGFNTHLKRISNWNEGEKINCFYIVDRKTYGVKTVLLPGTPSTLAFNFFQYGFIDNMYLSPNLEEIKLFPHHFKTAVQNYKSNVSKERSIFLKYFSVYPDFTTQQPAKHLIYIGISNNSFPLRDEPTGITYDEGQMISIITHQLSSIFAQCQGIGKESCIKVLYKAKNALLLSKTTGRIIKKKDLDLLTAFEMPFYAFQGEEMHYRHTIKQGLCRKIKENGNHACTLCIKEEQVADMDSDKESTGAIIEE